MARRSINLLAAAALTTASMMAGTVSMTWVGPATNNTYNGFYIGPYEADIAGSTTPTLVYCDDFNDEVTSNWNAYVTSNPFANMTNQVVSTDLQNTLAYHLFTNNQTPGPSNFSQLQTDVQDYEEIAYLTTQFSAPTQDWAGIATAIWSFFGQGKVTPVAGSDPTSTAYWINQASLHYTSINPAGITIYTPTLNTSGNLTSQEFITYTPSPEPSTFVILGSGMLLLGLGTWRTRNKSAR